MKAAALLLLLLLGACYDVDELSADYAPDLSASSDAGVVVAAVHLLAGGLGGPGNVDGIGSAARFNQPYQLAYNAQQRALYVTDHNNNLIRMIDVLTGNVTRVAGAPLQPGNMDGPIAVATMSAPSAITLDGDDLWVTDLNNRIFKVSQGQVTTVLTSVVSDGLLVQNGTLYYSEAAKNQVWRLTLSTPTGPPSVFSGTGVAGSLSGGPGVAEFSSPTGLIAYGSGFLLVDQGNLALRELDAAGNVSTVASIPIGTTTPATPQFGIAAGAAGVVYVANGTRHEVDEFPQLPSASTILCGRTNSIGDADGPAQSATFNQPEGVAYDGDKTLFIADRYNHTVRTLALDTMTVSTLAGAAAQAGTTDSKGGAARFEGPLGLAFDKSRNLILVADEISHGIRTVDLLGNTSTVLMQGGSDAGPLPIFTPTGVAVDGHDNIYFADADNNAIYVIDPGGEVRLLAGSPIGVSGSLNGTGAAARFWSPYDLTYDPTHDQLYVADTDNNAVRVVTPTGVVTTLGGTFNGPQGVTYDAANDELYVADTNENVIRKISFAPNAVSLVAGDPGMHGYTDGPALSAQFNHPHQLALDGAGSLYVADHANSTVRVIDLAAGMVRTLAGVPGHSAVVLGPLPALINEPTGLLWIAGFGLVVSVPLENALLVID